MATFVLATVALTSAVETVKPEWRDPEFGHRLRQLRKWKAEAPNRPLVLILGSSRAQMGISPRAMDMPNGSNDPLVYNFGYRGASPLWTWLILMRLLDCGIKPEFVVVQLALAECVDHKPAEQQLREWASRLSLADIRRLRPYMVDKWSFSSHWLTTRPAAWSGFSAGIRSELLPRWQSRRLRSEYTWEIMDEYGYVSYPSNQVNAAERDRWMHEAFHIHRRSISGAPISDIVRQVHCDLVARCMAEGIRVGFTWAPESQIYREAYGKGGTRSMTEYTLFLTEELNLTVFPAPVGLAEEHFADGYHLLPGAAKKYSQWLAETHLKPWLAQSRK